MTLQPIMNIVYVPCKDKVEAKRIARNLISQKLAICINIIDSIESVYLWKGKTEESYESLLIIKTSGRLVDKVIAKIKKLHSYNLPDILSWKIDKTTTEVNQWLTDELR